MTSHQELLELNLRRESVLEQINALAAEPIDEEGPLLPQHPLMTLWHAKDWELQARAAVVSAQISVNMYRAKRQNEKAIKLDALQELLGAYESAIQENKK